MGARGVSIPPTLAQSFGNIFVFKELCTYWRSFLHSSWWNTDSDEPGISRVIPSIGIGNPSSWWSNHSSNNHPFCHRVVLIFSLPESCKELYWARFLDFRLLISADTVIWLCMFPFHKTWEKQFEQQEFVKGPKEIATYTLYPEAKSYCPIQLNRLKSAKPIKKHTPMSKGRSFKILILFWWREVSPFDYILSHDSVPHLLYAWRTPIIPAPI